MEGKNQDMIRVGKISTTHGNKGAIKVQPYTDSPERFEELQEVYVVEGARKERLTITSVKYQKSNLILEVKEIPDMNSAITYRGKYLFIPREKAKKLPEGRYFIFDLIGLDVYEGQEHLGKIREVLQTGSNDVYVVQARQPGRKDILIPALKQVVKKIDLEAGRMDVVQLEQLDQSDQPEGAEDDGV